MTMPTPEQERVRVAGVYSAMSDEELGQIADSGDELSVIAQEAFQAEVARRGLKIGISNLLGGIKLKVRAEDAEAATEILNQPIPEMLDVEGVGEFEQPKCARCQSLDVTYMEYMRGWTCSACGNEWKEPGSAPSFS